MSVYRVLGAQQVVWVLPVDWVVRATQDTMATSVYRVLGALQVLWVPRVDKIAHATQDIPGQGVWRVSPEATWLSRIMQQRAPVASKAPIQQHLARLYALIVQKHTLQDSQ